MNTNVYRFNNELAINIPSAVLPPSRIEYVEERVEIPGYEAETTNWYDVIVRPYKGRTAVLLTSMLSISEPEAMSRLGLDPTKPIYIRPYGTNIWIPAHKYHGYYGRVWIPRQYVRRTKIRDFEIYPVIIRGTTMPEIRIIPVRKRVRDVQIEHMGETYTPEHVGEDRWRWIIPPKVESYHALQTAFPLRITPIAECNRKGDLIIIDFAFTRPAGKIVAEQTDYAYRNMAVRNYTATKKLDYPFLCEIRATYLTATPKMFYQPEDKIYIIKPGHMSNEHYMELSEALKITVYNILQSFFQRAKPDHPYSTMSWADHIDAIDFVTTKIKLHQAYSHLPRDLYMEYETDSDRQGENEYYRCIKYVRILNEHSYKNRNLDMYVYLDDDIEGVLVNRPEINVDPNGFIWEA